MFIHESALKFLRQFAIIGLEYTQQVLQDCSVFSEYQFSPFTLSFKILSAIAGNLLKFTVDLENPITLVNCDNGSRGVFENRLKRFYYR